MNDQAAEVETEGTDSRESTSVPTTVVPSAEELASLCADIKAGYDFNVDVKPVIFRFKTSKDENGVELKREPLELPIPYPTVEGIIAILEAGGKGLELLMEVVSGAVTSQARNMISDDHSLNAINLPVDKLSWDFIANMPKAERSGGGIPKEVWEDFGTDYITIMQEATGKDLERVTRASKLLVGKFSAIKTNLEAINFLVEQLAIYLDNSKRADEFAACVAFLLEKADKLVNATPEELLANL